MDRKTNDAASPLKLRSLAPDGDAILYDLYYIYSDHQIMGPYNQYDIEKLYITKQIGIKIWIKNLRFAEEAGTWIVAYLSKDHRNDEFRGNLPTLFNYLMPKINQQTIKRFDIPLDIPEDDKSLQMDLRSIIQILGKIISCLVIIIIGFHMLPTSIFAFICGLPFYCCCIKGDDDKENVWFGIVLTICYLGLIITPIFIVYVILMKPVGEWHEMQSWMIAYIFWGVFAVLFTMSVMVALFLETNKFRIILNWLFRIIGVEFDQVDLQSVFDKQQKFALSVVFLFPSVAALLPSTIIGFICNFILEERFELECNQEMTEGVLCYETDYGCCQIISSHEYRNSYEFIGGLASNILATWAIIRIIGFLMVNASPEISMFAKQNKY